MSEVLLTVLSGATLVIAAKDTRLDGAAMARFVQQHAVNLACLPPAVLGAFPTDCDLPVDLTLLVAGEACPQAIVDRWAPGRTMINAYGPTEATVIATASRPLVAGQVPPIGGPLDNVSAYVLDDVLGLVPDGVVGELYLAGPILATGYRGRPALTAERFVADPFGPAGSRMYRTGDLVRRAGGDLVFVGRDDDQLKIRGHRVEPAEIEAELLEHDLVTQAVVIPVRDSTGPTRLVAYVVPVPETEASGSELSRLLRDHLATRLPAYLLPAAVVRLDALPLTSRGKIDRTRLPAVDFGVDSRGRAPRDDRERQLCLLVADVLNVASVTIDDSFFDLGGDSIRAVQLVGRATAAGLRITPADVFLHPSVAELAVVTAGGTGERDMPADLLSTVLPLRPDGELPPLFCVHGALGLAASFGTLASRLGPRQPVFALQSPSVRDDVHADDVEELADTYLRTVRSIQPTGPVHLLGWSFGGLVAFEMAARLEAAGEPAGFLGLLDSYPAQNGDVAPDEQEILRGLLDNAGVDAVPHDQRLTVPDVLDALRATGGLLAVLDEPTLRRVLGVSRHHVALAGRYRPGRISGPVTLFTACGTDGEAAAGAAELAARWNSHVRGELAVHDVPCGHEHMMDRVPAATIAAILTARLGSGRDSR